MKEILLSVIVPAYNLEKYIEQCIVSIQNQIYTKIEIIIVDDGSVDNTLAICKRLAKDDDRIVVVSQKNAGVTMARRKGLSVATGDYVAFVDGDDYLEPEMYDCMMKNIAEYDMVSCGFFQYFSVTRVEKRYDDFQGGYTTNTQMEYIWKHMVYDFEQEKSNALTPALWNKIYKKDLAIRIMEGINPAIFYAEDAAFLFRYLLQSKSVFFLREAFYHYRYREESVCNSRNERMLENTNRIYLELKEVFEQHVLKKDLLAQLEKRTIDMTMNALNQYMGFSLKHRIPKFIIEIDDLRDMRLVLYGASQMGQDVKSILLKENIETVAWVDKNYKYFQNQNLEISAPGILETMEFDKLLIAVSKKALADSIKNELLEKGINEDKIIWRKPMMIY